MPGAGDGYTGSEEINTGAEIGERSTGVGDVSSADRDDLSVRNVWNGEIETL